MPRLSLTDRFVATCKAADDTPQSDFFDERTPGLALRVAAGGRKAWCFIFTSPRDNKRARITLGTYPATTLASARTKAREARTLLEAGEDPRGVLSAQAASAMTVTGLVESYLDKHVRPNLRAAPRAAGWFQRVRHGVGERAFRHG